MRLGKPGFTACQQGMSKRFLKKSMYETRTHTAHQRDANTRKHKLLFVKKKKYNERRFGKFAVD